VVQIHVRAPVSEKHISDELLDVSWSFSMLRDYHHQFPREPVWQRDPNQLAPLIVKCQCAYRNKTDPHSQGDEIDNEIKIIELHHRLDAPSLPPHPRANLLSGVGAFVDQQPVLFLEPLRARFCLCNLLQFR